MKLAYHGATSIRTDLTMDVRVTAQTGYKALEVWGAKVDDYLQRHSLRELRALFVDQGVEPASINSIEFIGFRGDDYRRIRERCRELCTIAEYIGCSTIVVVPSPTPQTHAADVLNLFVPWEQVVAEYVKVLRDLGDVASAHGVQLAFEFLGFGWCTVRTPRGAFEIVQEAAHDNVGMNFDCCHFYGGGGLLSEINDLDPHKILTFHLNDLENVPKEAITDGHRLLPGLGVIPLQEICARLRGIGYDGLCAIELFRSEYWDWDPYALAKAAREAALEILSSHFEVE